MSLGSFVVFPFLYKKTLLPFLSPAPPPPPPGRQWHSSIAQSSSSLKRMAEAESVLQLDAASSGSALPQDVLADILRRLPPRGLAVSRCVCTAWRDAVDARRLLRTDLLPGSVHGLLLKFRNCAYPSFLSRPSTAPGPDGIVDIFARGAGTNPDSPCLAYPLDHCNGLVLFRDAFRRLLVSNPATQRWKQLPPPPPFLISRFERLVFDPVDSLHYEVVLVPSSTEELNINWMQGWPPSTWFLPVFSSLTGMWEQRSFVREGELPRMCPEDDDDYFLCGGAYWRGALYLLCNAGIYSVFRISLSNHNYQVIKVPQHIDSMMYTDICLGRSDSGVCLAVIHVSQMCHVWMLDEACGRSQWVLKHEIDLRSIASRVLACDEQIEGPWMLQSFNSVQEMLHCDNNNDEGSNNSRHTDEEFEWDSDNDNVLDKESEVGNTMVYDEGGNNSRHTDEEFEWDSDNDNVLDEESEVGNTMVYDEGGNNSRHTDEEFKWDSDNDNVLDKESEVGNTMMYDFFTCLGFHPFKPIVFLKWQDKVVAFHLNTSKVQLLGFCTEYYENYIFSSPLVTESFPYTPCLMEEFHGYKSEAPAND